MTTWRTSCAIDGRTGGTALGAWISFAIRSSPRLLASIGFESVCIDLQHGFNDYDGMAHTLAAMARGGATPLVRVPWNEPGVVERPRPRCRRRRGDHPDGQLRG